MTTNKQSKSLPFGRFDGSTPKIGARGRFEEIEQGDGKQKE
jgi:hypothetical protein